MVIGFKDDVIDISCFSLRDTLQVYREIMSLPYKSYL